MGKKESLDEANEKRPIGTSTDDFQKAIDDNLQEDDRFKDIRELVFNWNEKQEKYISHLPSNKVCFPHHHQDKGIDIVPGRHYICMVYEPIDEKTGKPATYSFAKIISEVYEPFISVLEQDVVRYFWRGSGSDKVNVFPNPPKGGVGSGKEQLALGKTLGERIANAVIAIRDMGYQSVRIKFVENQKRIDKHSKE